jgi:hypothetical protein
MHRGVSTHEPVSSAPVHFDAHCGSEPRKPTFYSMPNTGMVLGHSRNSHCIIANSEGANVTRLPTTAGIEHRPIEEKPTAQR